MKLEDLSAKLEALQKEIDCLRAEADIRRLQARYMFLCDTPCPEAGAEGHAERIKSILYLYTQGAILVGAGAYYCNQFCRSVGPAAIRAHFRAPSSQKPQPARIIPQRY